MLTEKYLPEHEERFMSLLKSPAAANVKVSYTITPRGIECVAAEREWEWVRESEIRAWLRPTFALSLHITRKSWFTLCKRAVLLCYFSVGQNYDRFVIITVSTELLCIFMYICVAGGGGGRAWWYEMWSVRGGCEVKKQFVEQAMCVYMM